MSHGGTEMNKTIAQAIHDLWDILICDGGVDYFDDAIRETHKILKKYKIEDPDERQRVWQKVVAMHPWESLEVNEK